MGRFRSTHKMRFSGFTCSEIQKLERYFLDSNKLFDKEFYKRIARSFSVSAARAGKPVVNWTEVESWFQRKIESSKNDIPSDHSMNANTSTQEMDLSNNGEDSTQVNREIVEFPKLEFEARSSKDGAWYDVDKFMSHRYLPCGEAQVLVRFVGFGVEEDEWVGVKNAIRERSIPLENADCERVKVGDVVCCFQERRDRAIYFDAHVIEIQRKMHDIRGCRCLFLIRYDHDNFEEKVCSRRLCRRSLP